jgi:hypothetical protein
LLDVAHANEKYSLGLETAENNAFYAKMGSGVRHPFNPDDAQALAKAEERFAGGLAGHSSASGKWRTDP